nr:MAG TPA: hypothetical protein [Bacteriophage sp.]
MVPFLYMSYAQVYQDIILAKARYANECIARV